MSNHPGIKTTVKHSESKSAWNVIGETLGGKYKVARVPYISIEGQDRITQRNKKEALDHAEFISFCFNNPEKVQY